MGYVDVREGRVEVCQAVDGVEGIVMERKKE